MRFVLTYMAHPDLSIYKPGLQFLLEGYEEWQNIPHIQIALAIISLVFLKGITGETEEGEVLACTLFLLSGLA